MRLSTRARYGTRLLLRLALYYPHEPILLKDIAKDEDISEKYLSHIIIPLKGIGLVSSSRGAHGGYGLARDPKNITLREIVEVLEGDITPVECVKHPAICKRRPQCVTVDIWRALGDTIYSTLESITLDELVKRYRKKVNGKFGKRKNVRNRNRKTQRRG